MKKIKFVPIALFLTLFSFNVIAEEKIDCSSIKSDTAVGVYDKIRCKMGKPPREKGVLKKKLKGIFKGGSGN